LRSFAGLQAFQQPLGNKRNVTTWGYRRCSPRCEKRGDPCKWVGRPGAAVGLRVRAWRATSGCTDAIGFVRILTRSAMVLTRTIVLIDRTMASIRGAQP